MAALVLALLPVVFAFDHAKWLVQGLMAGAVKG
jgi:ABC-type glycerol-3-phosphate transport system permease component